MKRSDHRAGTPKGQFSEGYTSAVKTARKLAEKLIADAQKKVKK